MSTPIAIQPLPRTAFIFNGLMNTDKGFREFCDLITEFLEINVGNNRPLLLRIHSSGGIPEQVNALCGLVREAKRQNHEVTVHIIGQLCNFTYMVATSASKIVMEHTASLVFGKMRVTVSGTPLHIRNDLRYRKELFSKLCRGVANRSGGKLTFEEVCGWTAKHFTAEQALEYGLCDEVLAMPAAVDKTDLAEHVMRINESFSNGISIYNYQIELHDWLEKSNNIGRPLRVFFTSWGGTVVQALSLYGLFCEAQRQGHHVTIQVIGEAYSCALWFSTCAINSGEVLIDRDAMFMFHAPSTEHTGDLDELDAMLAIDDCVYLHTRGLLCMAPGFAENTLEVWAKEPDRYMTAEEVVKLGLGKLV